MTGEVLRPTAKTLNETFTEALRFWDGFFESQPIESCQAAATAAVADLDQLLAWQGVLHETCLVNGWGIWSEVSAQSGEEAVLDSTEDTISASVTFDIHIKRGEVEGDMGICRGFVLFAAIDQERPELYYIFETESWQAAAHSTFSLEGSHRLYVKAEGSEIIPAWEFESSFSSHPHDTVLSMISPQETISLASQRLVKLVSSTSFRRQKRQRQLEAVDELIQQAEDESLIKEADVLMTPQHGYVNEFSHEGEVSYLPVALGGLCIEGTCLGLTMLGREALTRKAIRRDSDLLSKHDGMSMSVEITKPVLLPDRVLGTETIIHVPLSGQQFECCVELNQAIYEVFPGESPGIAENSGT